jgi:glycine betaine/proline transport system substrate-binding protein
MVAALKKAYDNQEWIAVTGWTPHWKFASWDLKYLDDPKKSYGEAEHIDTVVRKGLKTDMPEVYELFDNFNWTSDDLSKAMIIAEEEGQTSKTGATKWVDQNQELVNSWLPEKYRS